MIGISWDGQTLFVKGHAGYAERGKDIVCAAVSSYCNACALMAELLWQRGEASLYETEIGEDCFRMKVTDPSELAREVLDGFVGLLSEIARQFPDYVKIQKQETV